MPQQMPVSPLALVCVVAPEDMELLDQWETHLQALQQANLISCWSELHLAAGASRECIGGVHEPGQSASDCR